MSKPINAVLNSKSVRRRMVAPVSGCNAVAFGVAAALACASAVNAAVDTTTMFGTAATDLSAGGNYSPTITPTAATTVDVELSGSYSSTTLDVSGAALKYGTLDDLDTTQPLVITNNSGAAGSIALSTAANSVSGTAADLLYVAAGGNLTIQNGTGGTSITAVPSGSFDNLGTLALNGPITITAAKTLTFSGTGTTTVNGVIQNTTGKVAVSAGTTVLTGTNLYSGTTTVAAASTLTATNTQAFGTGSVTIGSTSGAATLNLFNDGGTGTVTGQTIQYGTTPYNITATTSVINVGNNGNAGSTGNTIALGTLTAANGGVVSLTGSNGYGLSFVNFAPGGSSSNQVNSSVPVSFAGITAKSGASFEGTGTITLNGTFTSTAATGTSVNLTVGIGAVAGNVIDNLSTVPAVFVDQINNGTLTASTTASLGSSSIAFLATTATGATATLNLRNDASTNYGNNVSAVTSAGANFNVGPSTAGITGNTLTLGTLTTNQINTFTNSGGYNLAFGAVTSTSAATFANNMTNGMLTLASFTDSAANSQAITFSGTSATGTTAVTGAIAQGAGANSVLRLTDSGAGELLLGGTDTYTGATAVNNGTLVVDATGNAAAGLTGTVSVTVGTGALLSLVDTTATGTTALLNDAASLTLTAPTAASINLDLGGQTEVINTFFIGSTPQAAGVYSATTAPTGFEADEAYFTGNGSLTVTTTNAVVPEPVSAGLLSVTALGLLGRRRRRR